LVALEENSFIFPNNVVEGSVMELAFLNSTGLILLQKPCLFKVLISRKIFSWYDCKLKKLGITTVQVNHPWILFALDFMQGLFLILVAFLADVSSMLTQNLLAAFEQDDV
jgi:hypothetical protein